MSKQAAIEEALRLHLNDLVFSPALDIVDNVEQDFEPTLNEAYLEARWLTGETGTPFVTGGTKQYTGILQVTIVSPRGEGVQSATLLGDQVIEHFKQGTLIDGNGVRVKIARQPSMTAPTPDGPWLRTPVSVTYQLMA